jgi:TonB family protein
MEGRIMARMLFLLPLLLGAAAPAAAETPDQAKLREAQNWDVLVSRYPPRALAAGEEGLVGFKVTLDRDGYASACQVTHSSGHPLLDEETCQLITNRVTFKGMRGASGPKMGAVQEGVVAWKLPTTPINEALPAPVQLAKADAPEKLVCRRKLRTGSLADYERMCATRSDWDRMSQRTQEEWGSIQGAFGSTHGN